ncbi:MAG: DUF2007 domain-containing protein [Bacteroidaceae bacterium]|nr:DUF2007 domain-containing protein [Bacteroidales bacterium]MBQ3121153.1 DUF2007 domain-containing protein [Bacteroidaceae bacterium]MBQ3152666.1 DUF2007 domain-containing protein [Bacteroidaceae bacterium]MBR6806204.1 DUF2007 domain-containing protein [Bacteroidaceae bacterium]
MSDRRSQNKLVKVFSGSLWQAQVIQGLLEANHIVSMLENETLSAVTSPYATLGGEVFVLVDIRDRDFAVKLISTNSLSSVPYN